MTYNVALLTPKRRIGASNLDYVAADAILRIVDARPMHVQNARAFRRHNRRLQNGRHLECVGCEARRNWRSKAARAAGRNRDVVGRVRFEIDEIFVELWMIDDNRLRT